jgi:hypothetical protein
MECLLGLLKVRVVRGVHLAICDPLTHSSDPYVVLRHGKQVKYKLHATPAFIAYSSISPLSILLNGTVCSSLNRFFFKIIFF